MKFCVINSGSSGNMTYVEYNGGAILIDAGITLTRAKKMADLDYSKVKAIFITHEHIDHIHYLDTISKKLNIPIYIHKKCFKGIFKNLLTKLKQNNALIFFIDEDSHYDLFDLDIYTLKLSHDSKACLGFLFIEKETEKKLMYITDTGFFPTNYIPLAKTVDGLIIEANHDIEMLVESGRPYYLIQRILSPEGHMSNYICYQLLKEVCSDIKVIVLAHLSKDCNSLECVKRDILDPLKDYKGKIVIASRYEATKLIKL